MNYTKQFYAFGHNYFTFNSKCHLSINIKEQFFKRVENDDQKRYVIESIILPALFNMAIEATDKKKLCDIIELAKYFKLLFIRLHLKKYPLIKFNYKINKFS